MIRILLLCKSLILMFALSASALDLSQLTDEERALLRAEVRSYLLDNPEVLFEAARIYQERQSEIEAQAEQRAISELSEALFSDSASWAGGNLEGDVTLVEFLDYRCGYCRRAAPEVEQLVEADGNIRLIVKEFPILGDESVLMSRFAIATLQIAGAAAYKQVHDRLIELQNPISNDTLRDLANDLNLKSDEIMAHMEHDSVSEVLLQNRTLAQRLNISGTPAFVLSDRVIRGFLPAADMLEVIEELRS
ncbi:MAG: DsbA family protein [Aestuariivita sp.]|nr:DsbA family protein [Aestuariivita sp.]